MVAVDPLKHFDGQPTTTARPVSPHLHSTKYRHPPLLPVTECPTLLDRTFSKWCSTRAMLVRIGIVLYWMATTVAAFLALGTVMVLIMGAFNMWRFKSENNVVEAFVFIPALLIWLIGRASRYFLAGT